MLAETKTKSGSSLTNVRKALNESRRFWQGGLAILASWRARPGEQLHRTKALCLYRWEVERHSVPDS